MRNYNDPDPSIHLGDIRKINTNKMRLSWYKLDNIVWNLTFVFNCIKVREDFLPIPAYVQNFTPSKLSGENSSELFVLASDWSEFEMKYV